MPKNQYILLTGGKNNAGDFLIKYKAKRLFAALKPDRDLLDWDAWKPFTEEQLNVVNESKAIILLGGPSLQGDMYPRIYPMVDDLSKIKVPIFTMGVGYKEENGHWHNTSNYPFTERSLGLLRRINENGFKNSVRCYHTLNVVLNKGWENFIMTGCPALYELDKVGSPYKIPERIEKIAFSLGVSYYHSDSMMKQMLSVISALATVYGKSTVTVYLHHKLNEQDERHALMLKAIDSLGVRMENISGSEQRLVEVYGDCDFHVGYRVHAHVHASSMSRPSILLNEDSRGKGFYTVMAGTVLDAYYSLPRFNRPDASLMYKMMGAIKKITSILKKRLPMEAYEHLADDVILQMEYEKANGFPRLAQSRAAIDAHFAQMKRFIEQLP